MNKIKALPIALSPLLLFTLSACHSIGDKSASMSLIYTATTLFSLLLLVGYLFFVKKKESWFYVLFVSVLVVNAGYLLLALSKTLGMALWANRIAYLGSVLLPLSMIKIIQSFSRLKCSKWVSIALVVVSAAVFLIAASPGVFDIYYKTVTLESIGGASVLNKEYGSWHCVYLFYLLGYFSIMITTTVYAIVKKKIEEISHAVVILIAVFVNIFVWLFEQLVRIDFEILSVSYIITEFFLLSVCLMMQRQERLIERLKSQYASTSSSENSDSRSYSEAFIRHCSYITEQLPTLTPTERAVYDCYLAGKSTREVLAQLSIRENTLKFHNKNLYGKLGVKSRKQLVEYAMAIRDSDGSED